jgi:DNA processing protein
VSGDACPECWPRGVLLCRLAGHIGRSVDRGAGRRARDLLALGDRQLAAAVAGEASAAELVAASRSPESLRSLERSLEASGCWMICRHDRVWPDALGRLGDAEPRALFGRGDPALLEGLGRSGGAATIVGARRAGAYGREVAEALGYGLASAGVRVVSGLALGIDAAAHEGCVRADEPAVAVLAGGPERAYPRSAARLYRELIAGGGAIVSELPPGSTIRRWMFPARNRIMAAAGEITVVVEAAERSGSLITAEMAADCGRAVGAVPGPVNTWRSSGTNLLLVDGAVPIRGAGDVLEHLFGAGAWAEATGPRLGERELIVLDAVESGATTPDAIATAAGRTAPACAASLARLELAGYVEVDVAGRSSRTLLRPPAKGGGRANTIGP